MLRKEMKNTTCKKLEIEMKRLFENLLAKLPLAKEYHTDGYYPYKCWLNRKQQKVSKFGKTNRNEGLHLRLRNRLKRLQKDIAKILMH